MFFHLCGTIVQVMRIKAAVSRKKKIIRASIVLAIIIALICGTAYLFWAFTVINSCKATYIRHSDGTTSQMSCAESDT